MIPIDDVSNVCCHSNYYRSKLVSFFALYNFSLYVPYITLCRNLNNVSNLILMFQIFAACFQSDISLVKTFLLHGIIYIVEMIK